MKIKGRSSQLELIDLGSSYYTKQEYEDCLLKLDRIGRFLGGDKASFWAFDRLKKSPTSIIDVGCGGGFFTRRLSERYPQARVMGTDLSTEAIAFADQKNKQKTPSTNISFTIPAQPELDLPEKSVDVVTCTLVCHHLQDQDIIEFLRRSYKIAKQAIIINDLHRHPLARLGFAALAPVFFPNRLIFHDGLLSIQRSFTRKEWVNYLEQAGIPAACYSITWHWPFRWIVLIQPFETHT